MTTTAVNLEGLRCDVCGGDRFLPVDFDSYMISTRSSVPELHEFVNHVCEGCGVVVPYPMPDIEKLIGHYKTDYRKGPFAVTVGDRVLEPPIQIPWSGVSFVRFQSFHDAVQRAAGRFPDVVPDAGDTMIDFGAYQGLFLYAAAHAYGCRGVAYDFSETGIDFARKALGLEASVVAKDIYSDTFGERVRFATLIHVFEHLQYPTRFLEHLSQNVLTEDGWLYIEVPSAVSFPLSDPRHYYSYTAENLRYLLEKCGFQVVEAWYAGHPESVEFPYHSERMNLHALARRVPAGTVTPTKPSVPAIDIYNQIRSEGRRIGLKYARRETGRIVKEAVGLAYSFLALAAIDFLPVDWQRKLKTPARLEALMQSARRLKRSLVG